MLEKLIPQPQSRAYLLVKGLNWEVHGSKLDFEAGSVSLLGGPVTGSAYNVCRFLWFSLRKRENRLEAKPMLSVQFRLDFCCPAFICIYIYIYRLYRFLRDSLSYIV